MKLVFDFDHTLFDMMAMHEAIEAAVVALGIDVAAYRESYTQVTNWKAFTVAALASHLSRKTKVKESKIIEALEEVVQDSGDWLYPDVRDGLEAMRDAGHELYLLSWGDMEWQMKKIQRCSILPMFKEVLSIAQMKADYLKSWHKNGEGRVVLIDDKPAELKAVENSGQDIGLIRMRRAGAKYSDQETPQGMSEAKEMSDVLAIVTEWSS